MIAVKYEIFVWGRVEVMMGLKVRQGILLYLSVLIRRTPLQTVPTLSHLEEIPALGPNSQSNLV